MFRRLSKENVTDLPRVARRHKQLSRLLEQTNAELQGVESELTFSRRRGEELEAQLAATTAVLKEMSAERDQMRASYVWRLGSNVHRVTSRLAPGPRRWMRGLAKSLYWLAMAGRTATRGNAQPPTGQSLVSDLPTGSEAPENEHTPLDLRLGLKFTPCENACALAHEAGHYGLTLEPTYTYIPPRKPAFFSRDVVLLQTHFSIIVPVFNTPVTVFRSMVTSVTRQWYPDWELILVDDCSSSIETKQALDWAKNSDDRIQVITLETNHGISDATNEGLKRAVGDYITFLDHDDELTEDCLWELAQAIDRDGSDYIYSDSDKITPSGGFSEPFFKPDWSPDTLMSLMYTGQVCCIRRELLHRVGLLRKEFDGSQDWDLALRATEQANRITHVPKVLYHWRVIAGSAAGVEEAKPYAIDAGRRVRQDALRRRGLRGTIHPLEGYPAFARVRYAVEGSPAASIIIPSKNNGAILKRCIDSIIERTRYDRYEFVVVDNGSTEPDSLACFSELQKIQNLTVLRNDSAFNWSALNNFAVRHASGDFLLFLNDDTEALIPGWLEEMIGYAQLAHVGAVGAKLLYPPGDLVQHNGVTNLYFGPSHSLLGMPKHHPGPFFRNLLEFNYVGVTGACLLIDRRKFERLGGFNENIAVAYNDVDFCFRLLEHGWYNVVCQGAELIHHESFSRGNDAIDPVKRERAITEWKRLYQAHPQFYLQDLFSNPNLHPNDINYAAPN